MMVLIWCGHSAEDFNSSVQRGMVARIKQARRYFREANNALHHIEVVPVMKLRVENVANAVLFCSLSLDDRGITNFPMEMLTSHRDLFPGTLLVPDLALEIDTRRD
jgi:hypothetical protein